MRMFVVRYPPIFLKLDLAHARIFFNNVLRVHTLYAKQDSL